MKKEFHSVCSLRFAFPAVAVSHITARQEYREEVSCSSDDWAQENVIPKNKFRQSCSHFSSCAAQDVAYIASFLFLDAGSKCKSRG